MPSCFFNDTATTEISPLSLHDALPICLWHRFEMRTRAGHLRQRVPRISQPRVCRSEEHTSELQSRLHPACPLVFLMTRPPPRSPLFPYTTLFRSAFGIASRCGPARATCASAYHAYPSHACADRKSTRLNSSHGYIPHALLFF